MQECLWDIYGFKWRIAAVNAVSAECYFYQIYGGNHESFRNYLRNNDDTFDVVTGVGTERKIKFTRQVRR